MSGRGGRLRYSYRDEEGRRGEGGEVEILLRLPVCSSYTWCLKLYTLVSQTTFHQI